MSEDNPGQLFKRIPSAPQRRQFRIEVRGQVGEGWVAVFDPLSVFRTGKTTRFEVLADQAALRGILNRLWDLNIDILSVIEIDEPAI